MRTVLTRSRATHLSSANIIRAMKRPAVASPGSPPKASPTPSAKVPARTQKANARAARVGLALPQSNLPATDRILEAATEFFAIHGYVNSTLDDVAALAGFTKGAVYYYFKDKESLLVEVLKRIAVRSIDTTTAKVKEHAGSAAEKLEMFVRCQTRWAAQHPRDLAILMLVSAETAHTSQRVRSQVLRSTANSVRSLRTSSKRESSRANSVGVRKRATQCFTYRQFTTAT